MVGSKYKESKYKESNQVLLFWTILANLSLSIFWLSAYNWLPPNSLKEHKMEAIFLVDCSGSMSGQSIKVRADLMVGF